MIDPSEVTIIIPHLGATKEEHFALRECLKSLRETSESPIIVAKNGLDYMGEPIDYKFYDYASKIALSEQGQCKAVNAAAATVNTPWIFVTNDDMIFPEDWFDRLTYRVDQEYMCLSPKLIEPRPGAPTFEVQPFGGAGGDFDKQKFNEFVKNDYYKREEGWSWRPGFNLPFLIKKELWDLIGGYDINYDPWGSNGDSDLEYKVKLAGVQPIQNAFACVYHFSQTSGTFHPDNDAARFRNYAYFKEKWGFDRTDDGIWEATFEIPDQGRVFRPYWENHYGEQKPLLRGMRLGETYGD